MLCAKEAITCQQGARHVQRPGTKVAKHVTQITGVAVCSLQVNGKLIKFWKVLNTRFTKSTENKDDYCAWKQQCLWRNNIQVGAFSSHFFSFLAPFLNTTEITIVAPYAHFEIKWTAYLFPELFCNDYFQCMTQVCLLFSILQFWICHDLRNPLHKSFSHWKSVKGTNKP